MFGRNSAKGHGSNYSYHTEKEVNLKYCKAVLQLTWIKSDMICICNPSTQESDIGVSWGIKTSLGYIHVKFQVIPGLNRKQDSMEEIDSLE